MIHITAGQFARLKEFTDEVNAKHAPKRKRSSEPKIFRQTGLSEKHVTTQVLDILRADKWEVVRVNIGTAKLNDTWVRFGGRKGTPDHFAYRPVGFAGVGIILWIEFKKEKGGELSPEQITRQRELIATGARVINVGHAKNAPSDLECVEPERFRDWYWAFKKTAEEVLGEMR